MTERGVDMADRETVLLVNRFHPETIKRLDGIDFNVTSQRSITVTNTPDVLNDAVADLALSLILATHRNLIQADQHVRSGSWLKAAFPFSRSLAGRPLLTPTIG